MYIKKMFSIDEKLLDGILVIYPEIFSDKRGLFFESWNQKEFDRVTGSKLQFKQDNYSESSKGVLRGLHFQSKPKEQGKLISCTLGKIFDVVVDLRERSPTFSKWGSIELDSEDKRQLWVPPGFAHGFITLSSKAIVQYKTTQYWDKDSEYTILYNDKDINIKWPLEKIFPKDINLSLKDSKGISLKKALLNKKLF
tara:strand:- start:4480 stop:5067 length:588 start_codon:yes stop_codon:yes gene_type:complete